jgi:programmed cell death protein 5
MVSSGLVSIANMQQAARDRLRRIAIVKPDRARSVEDLIIRMAQSGQVRQRITEPELVGLLEEIAGQEGARQQTKIINARRRDLDDSDDDWN